MNNTKKQTKKEKAALINFYLKKENNTDGKAVILEDGRIEYQIKKHRGAHTYIIKATFREILMLLHGEHIREILKKLN